MRRQQDLYLTPYVSSVEDAASRRGDSAAHDCERLRQQHYLPGAKRAWMECAHQVEEGVLLEVLCPEHPPGEHLHDAAAPGHFALQVLGDVLLELGVLQTLQRGAPRLVHISPKAHLEIVWQTPGVHTPLECVNAMLEVLPLWIHPLQQCHHLAYNVCPDVSYNDHAEGANPVLRRVLCSDVSIPNGRQRHRCPIEGNGINTKGVVFSSRSAAITLGSDECREPGFPVGLVRQLPIGHFALDDYPDAG
mmetsp:Transcript_82400/g.241877  ORF Transcript_82400/g.241877 Transcript_82400/m.241877 type:complete len:248 (-) Transcript_82400:241-984(-)